MMALMQLGDQVVMIQVQDQALVQDQVLVQDQAHGILQKMI